jgi:mono/diheme cytochrome c family protein
MRIGSLAVFLGAAFLLSAADAVTFSETIAPMVYNNCVTCHRPGEAAPFSLISYEDVKKRGTLIAAVTKSRYMPPWHAEHGYGEFAEERRLTDAQIAAIGEWVKQGMPEGDPTKMPKLPKFTEGWHLGKPDLILEMPDAYEVPASGPDIYRNFAIPTGLAEDKWVRAVEFRPGARKAVHHALFAYVRSGALKSFEGQDGKPGFTGMNGLGLGLGLQPAFQPAGGLGGWAVGGIPAFLPEGQALPLAKGTDLILQMHFHPTGKPETERSTIGIYFADKAPEKRLMGVGLPFLFGIGSALDIPPGADNYTIQESTTLPTDVRVYGVAAHAHYIGKEMKATATLPDGTTQPLLWIKDWDFNWQEQYTYKQPVLLPKGTKVDVSIRYDNSSGNPRNPSDPPRRVQWGEQSFDEMGGIGLTMVTVRKEDEPVLRQFVAEGMKQAIAKALSDGTVKRYLESQQRSRAAAGSPQPR